MTGDDLKRLMAKLEPAEKVWKEVLLELHEMAQAGDEKAAELLAEAGPVEEWGDDVLGERTVLFRGKELDARPEATNR